MCGDNNLFGDLEDKDFWNSDDVVVEETAEDKALKEAVGTSMNRATNAIYEEKCTARGCRNGTFVSWAGNPIGPCFKCKGTGIRKFKTSPETREKQREYAKKRKAAKEQAKLDKAAAYKEQHAELFKYLDSVSGWNGFAANLLAGVEKYGALTEKQFAAADRMYQKHLAKQAEKASEPTSGLDLTDIPKGMYAVPSGDTRLKVAIRKPGKNSRWHGHIFVDDGAVYGARQNYGRQAPGKEYEGKIIEELKKIAADPFEASKAYGRLVGACGVCGRVLEDEKSIEAGIGPICAKKF